MANDATTTKPTSAAPEQLNASNKGFQMMKLLGWKGGSLGIKGDGIEEPISVEVRVKRTGLGLSATDQNASTKETRAFFVKYLKKYMDDEMATHDLVFAKEFSKEERAMLHQ